MTTRRQGLGEWRNVLLSELAETLGSGGVNARQGARERMKQIDFQFSMTPGGEEIKRAVGPRIVQFAKSGPRGSLNEVS